MIMCVCMYIYNIHVCACVCRMYRDHKYPSINIASLILYFTVFLLMEVSSCQPFWILQTCPTCPVDSHCCCSLQGWYCMNLYHQNNWVPNWAACNQFVHARTLVIPRYVKFSCNNVLLYYHCMRLFMHEPLRHMQRAPNCKLWDTSWFRCLNPQKMSAESPNILTHSGDLLKQQSSIKFCLSLWTDM